MGDIVEGAKFVLDVYKRQQEGSLDIGLSSRAVKEEETGVTGTTIALDGIAIIVNSENPVADLSLEQMAGIAKGEITNWSEVGGDDAEIVFIGREAGSGTRDGFESIVGVEDECVYSEELTATGAVIAKVQSNANAIGYASLSADVYKRQLLYRLQMFSVSPSSGTGVV